jgi:hypothetical protein
MMHYYGDEFYMNHEQQKTIENVITFLAEQKKQELITPILDLMRMSENWYGRLDELRSQLSLPQPKPEAEHE